jgi:hypothetical protein
LASLPPFFLFFDGSTRDHLPIKGLLPNSDLQILVLIVTDSHLNCLMLSLHCRTSGNSSMRDFHSPEWVIDHYFFLSFFLHYFFLLLRLTKVCWSCSYFKYTTDCFIDCIIFLFHLKLLP